MDMCVQEFKMLFSFLTFSLHIFRMHQHSPSLLGFGIIGRLIFVLCTFVWLLLVARFDAAQLRRTGNNWWKNFSVIEIFSSWLLKCSPWGAPFQTEPPGLWKVSKRSMKRKLDKTCFMQKPVPIFQFWLAIVTSLPVVLSLLRSPTEALNIMFLYKWQWTLIIEFISTAWITSHTPPVSSRPGIQKSKLRI